MYVTLFAQSLKILLGVRGNLIVVNTLYSKLMCKSNCMYLVPCKLTTIRFPHTARFSKIVQTGIQKEA